MTSDHTFHLEIVTPDRNLFNGEVISVNLPGMVSPFQVLVNHAPIVSALEVGVITIMDPAEATHVFATSGGFAEMNHNRLTVTVETAEPADSIDVQRAERAEERAAERVRMARWEHDREIDMVRAEAALARAINRLKVASRIQV